MLDFLLSDEESQTLSMMIDKSAHVLVTCHVSPDGDALGSMLAFYHFLHRRGKKVTAVTPNIFPEFLKWMPGADEILTFDKQADEVKAAISDVNLVVCLDFNSPERLEELTETVVALDVPMIMIDHHPFPATERFSLSISHPEMCATCELLYRILVQIDARDRISYDEAVCLYTGMMTDTGCFSYNSNRSEVYCVIAELLEKGIDKDKIYRQIYYSYPADRFRLMGYLLYVKMETFPEYHAALITLERDEQKRFSYKKGDTEGFVNIPLQIKGNKLSIFMRENAENGTIRVSLRSVDDFPCNKMAEDFFHGGGHLNAAGGTLECSMQEAVKQVHEALKKYAPLLKSEE